MTTRCFRILPLLLSLTFAVEPSWSAAMDGLGTAPMRPKARRLFETQAFSPPAGFHTKPAMSAHAALEPVRLSRVEGSDAPKAISEALSESAMDKVLAAHGIGPGKTLVVVGPGLPRGAHRSWEWAAVHRGADVILYEPEAESRETWVRTANEWESEPGRLFIGSPEASHFTGDNVKARHVDGIIMMSVISSSEIPFWQRVKIVELACGSLRPGSPLIVGWYKYPSVFEWGRTEAVLVAARAKGFQFMPITGGEEGPELSDHHWVAYQVKGPPAPHSQATAEEYVKRLSRLWPYAWNPPWTADTIRESPAIRKIEERLLDYSITCRFHVDQVLVRIQLSRKLPLFSWTPPFIHLELRRFVSDGLDEAIVETGRHVYLEWPTSRARPSGPRPSISPEEVAHRMDHLKLLKENASDDIPKDIVHAGKFKVRKNWWNGLLGDLSLIVKYQLIADAELVERVERLMERVTSTEFHDRLTTADDIRQANQLIDDVLASYSLSKRAGGGTRRVPLNHAA